MRNRILLLVGLMAAGTWSVPVRAQSSEAMAGMMMMGDGPVLVIPMLLEFGDLSPEQADHVRQIVAARRTDTEKLLSQLAATNNELAEALLAPADGRARNAGSIVERLAQLRLQFMRSELKTVLAIRKVLTPEQLSKVIAAVDKMKRAETGQLDPRTGVF